MEAAEAAEMARTTVVAAHERKARPHTGGREPIPPHLPRQEIVHDVAPRQKWCEHDGACWLRERIGEEVSERYHYEAPKVWVERHVYPKYGCRHCRTVPGEVPDRRARALRHRRRAAGSSALRMPQHCRTHFNKAKKITEIPSGRALARVAMEDYIGRVFKIERELTELREARQRAGAPSHRRRSSIAARTKPAPILAA
ncbi:transposase, partial [mine drainage metagenome]